MILGLTFLASIVVYQYETVLPKANQKEKLCVCVRAHVYKG